MSKSVNLNDNLVIMAGGAPENVWVVTSQPTRSQEQSCP